MQVGITNNSWADAENSAQRPEQGDDFAPAPMPSIPMYLAGLIVTGAGLHAANISLTDSSFAALILGLTLIGFATSYITRLQNIAPRNVELPALVVCVCVVLMAVLTDPADSFLAPQSVAEDRSKALALLLTWLIVFRSFTLTSDASLLFCCVPTIALIGLVGTSTSDPMLSTIFVIFAAAAVFMMVHENVRQTGFQQRFRRRVQAAHTTAAGWSGQLQVTIACTLLALLVANITSPFVQDAGSFVRVNSGLSTLKTTADRAISGRTADNSRTELPVGSGPVSLSDEIVFTVRSDEEHYWRGATYDRYTGYGWQNTLTSSAMRLPEMTDAAPDPLKPDQQAYSVVPSEITQRGRKYHGLDQYIRFVQGSTSDIYGAGEIRKVVISRRNILADEGGSIRLGDMLTNAEYEVRSEIPEMTSAARSAAPGGYPRKIENYYFQLPLVQRDSISRIREKAQEITASKASAFDKVEALTTWIGGQCKYNTATPRFPDGRDVVDYFLFDARQGYCDSFATSLAVLCRTIGIPARVVSGYVAGDADSATGQFVVREKHKHLWTEVYFNGVGWVPFDATSGADDISPAQATAQAKNKGFWARLLAYGWWPPALLGIVLVLVLYVLKVEVFDRFYRPRRDVASLGLPETNLAIVLEYETACRVLGTRGALRLPTETAREFLARAAGSQPGSTAASPLTTLTDLVSRYRYSSAIASEHDVQRARECTAAIVQALRGTPRRRPSVSTPAQETA